MDTLELMRQRHSVRSYLDKPIEEEKAETLRSAMESLNSMSGLHMQLFLEEPEAFKAEKAHYGAFKGCRNYIAMVGAVDADEDVGYYGEELVLLAQSLGLNTCWVALTYRKGKVKAKMLKGEKLHVVIALGYGADQGVPHKSKPIEKVADVDESTPDWFLEGMEAALLAPTAVNQQQFHFSLEEDRVTARAKIGPYAKLDLGIVKYHFELVAGRANFRFV